MEIKKGVEEDMKYNSDTLKDSIEEANYCYKQMREDKAEDSVIIKYDILKKYMDVSDAFLTACPQWCKHCGIDAVDCYRYIIFSADQILKVIDTDIMKLNEENVNKALAGKTPYEVMMALKNIEGYSDEDYFTYLNNEISIFSESDIINKYNEEVVNYYRQSGEILPHIAEINKAIEMEGDGEDVR